MKILMVTPYPPAPDGIASYAVQTVQRLRDQRHEVEVLSPGPSAAHYHLDLAGSRGALALAKRLPGYDRVIIQFHPDFFFPAHATPRERTVIATALAAAFSRAHEIEVRVHEVDYAWGRGRGVAARAVRAMWRQVDRVVMHSQTERDDFLEAFGVQAARVEVVDHGADFMPRTRLTRDQARVSLGIRPDAFTFLAIGFVQPHKGFDRAVRAFAGLGEVGARIDVVGSVRVDDPEYVRYAADLQEVVDQVSGAQLHLGYVSDERFDRWIAASDVVVLPYRSIWSSSVIERARLFPVNVIATDVGGLAEQLGDDPRCTLVANDEGALAAAMWAAAGNARDMVVEAWPSDSADLRGSIQDEIERRAAVLRGGSLRGRAVENRKSPTAVSQPLRLLEPIRLPAATSSRPGVGLLKRAVRTLTAWQLEPMVAQVNALRVASIRSVEKAAIERDPGASSDSDGQPEHTSP